MKNIDYRRVFNALAIGALIFEQENQTVVDYNDSICDILSINQKELVGKRIDAIVADIVMFNSELKKLTDPVQDMDKASSLFSAQLINNTGDPVNALISIKGLQKSKSQGLVLMEVYEPEWDHISFKADLIKSLEREKELGKLKSQFVTTASHQFRTPLTVIQTNMALIKMQMAGIHSDSKEKLDSLCDRITYQVGKMTSIMNEILILGKIDSRGIIPKYALVDVVDFISDMIEKINMLYHDRVITVRVSGVRKEILMDAHLLEHAINNLITNAMKYSQESKDPEVTLEMRSDEFVVKVQDYGVGIPPEDLPRIYDPFFRASNVDAISGTGLGMAIVKEYIELNRGTIHVESELNKGTKVVCKFRVNHE